MEKQLIMELLELIGQRAIEFTDTLQAKMSPHSQPTIIEKVMVDAGNVLVGIRGQKEVTKFDDLSMPVKCTIAQRLRLIYSRCTSTATN